MEKRGRKSEKGVVITQFLPLFEYLVIKIKY